MKNSGVSMDEDVNTAKDISKNTGGDREEDVPRPKIPKKKIMVNTPEPEQLATLNLKEGKNVVVFTCSKQQVTSSHYISFWYVCKCMLIICLRFVYFRLMHVYICGDGTQIL